AVDLHRGFTKQGLRYVFHLARDGHRTPAMKELAQRASMVVTDLFPLPPWTDWVRAVAELTQGPVVEVDGHCVIPMPLYGRSVDRPFKFRDGTKKLRKQRLQRRWPDLGLSVEAYDGDLPFEPVMVEHQLADLDQRWALLQQCNIDPDRSPRVAVQGWRTSRPRPLAGVQGQRAQRLCSATKQRCRCRRCVPHVGLHSLRDDLADAHRPRSR
ncbi:MAG: hypothetical protein ACPIA6_06090, partial [Poseidonia sp.]